MDVGGAEVGEKAGEEREGVSGGGVSDDGADMGSGAFEAQLFKAPVRIQFNAGLGFE